MSTIIDQLKDYLKKKEVRFEYDEQNNCLRVQFDGKNTSWRGRAFISEKTGVNFYSYVPVKCPENRRKTCAELLNHLNCNLGFGNFEMDTDDGEMRFRNSVPLLETASEELFEYILNGHHYVVDETLPKIAAVAFGGLTAMKAVELHDAPAVEPDAERFSLN